MQFLRIRLSRTANFQTLSASPQDYISVNENYYWLIEPPLDVDFPRPFDKHFT